MGEAVEVVDGVVTVNDVDGGDGGLPVAGDDEDGIGAGGEDLVLPWLEEVAGGEGVVDGEGGGAVGNEEGVHILIDRLSSAIRDAEGGGLIRGVTIGLRESVKKKGGYWEGKTDRGKESYVRSWWRSGIANFRDLFIYTYI